MIEKVANYEERLTRVKNEIKAYETSAKIIREQDKQRAESLMGRERKLRAGWRALNQEKQDFEDEKKRFYQTRELQT